MYKNGTLIMRLSYQYRDTRSSDYKYGYHPPQQIKFAFFPSVCHAKRRRTSQRPNSRPRPTEAEGQMQSPKREREGRGEMEGSASEVTDKASLSLSTFQGQGLQGLFVASLPAAWHSLTGHCSQRRRLRFEDVCTTRSNQRRIAKEPKE